MSTINSNKIRISRLSAKGQDFIVIIRTYRIFVIGFIARFGTAAGATKEENDAFFVVELISGGLQKPLAGVFTITGINIDVFATKAKWTMISAPSCGRGDTSAAGLAIK